MNDEEVFRIIEEIALANDLTIDEVKEMLDNDAFVIELTNIMILEEGIKSRISNCN